MIFFFLLTLLLTAISPAPASGQTVEWTRRTGTLGGDEALGVAADASGAYVVGYTAEALPDLDKVGRQDAFIRKYDDAGNVLWTRQFGSVFDDYASAAAADSTGVYVAGTVGVALGDLTDFNRTDAFVRKYDAAGNLLWNRQVGSAGGTPQDDFGNAVAVDATGVYVAGYTAGNFPTTTRTGRNDAFVRKYDLNGNELWTRQFGVSGVTFAVGVAANASGVYLLGTTDGVLPGQSHAGGVYDIFLRKYDANGNEQWTRQFGTSSLDLAGGIAADNNGITIVGSTAGNLPGSVSFPPDLYFDLCAFRVPGSSGYAAFVRRYDAAGAAQWTNQSCATGDVLAATGDVLALGITASGGKLYVTGNVFGTLPGQVGAGGANEDSFVRKYDTAGNVLSTRQFGTAQRDRAYAVAVSGQTIYTAGSTPRLLLSPDPDGDPDALLSKLTEGAQPVPSVNTGGVVNAASLTPQAPMAPGSIASAFGVAFVPPGEDRVLVRLNGISAPIFAVTPTQINFQVPWELAGLSQASLTVTVGGFTSVPVAVLLAAAAPGLFSTSASGAGQGAILIANTSSLAAPAGAFTGSRPANRGGIISIYCTGLGAVTNPTPTGTAASVSPLSRTPALPTVRIGGVAAPVAFSGLAPGFVGLYQVDVQVPAGAPTGNAVPVDLTIGGSTSNVVAIAVQ